MTRNELSPKLQKVFGKKNPFGVVKAQDSRFKHLWFVIPPPPPRENPAFGRSAALAKAHRALQTQPLYEQASPLDLLVSFLFLRREAVQSSRMEGTWSTIDQIFTPQVKPNRSEQSSVKGYARALEKVFVACRKSGYKIFSIPLIQTLHREVMRYDPHFRGLPGSIRGSRDKDGVVFIGGLTRVEESIFNPPPPPYVSTCLTKVLHWFKDMEVIEMGNAGMGMSLPIRLAVGHVHFEAVHPFSDGNGRVGRMLMALQMACEGMLPLFLSGFIEANRTEYTRGLSTAQKRLDYRPIIEFFSEAIFNSHLEAEKTKTIITSLPKVWENRGKFRETSASKRALSWIISHPIFSVEDLKRGLKISAPAAHRAANQLTKHRIVRERTRFGRNRLFAAEEVIELLSRDFGEDPARSIRRAELILKI